MSAPKAQIATALLGSAIAGFALCVVAGPLLLSSINPCLSYCANVVELSAVDNVVFATTVDFDANHHTYRSCDGGHTWTSTNDACGPRNPPDITATLKAKTKTICNPALPNNCLRILMEQGTLEESLDGGSIWNPVKPLISMRDEVRCKNRPCDATDIAFVRAGSSYDLVVGMIEVGVVVRTQDGNWFQRTVSDISGIS